MKKYILKIRSVDKIVFDAIADGKKIIETRVATDKYREIKAGDILVFVCNDKKLEKIVQKVQYFKEIDEMAQAIDFKKVMPFVDSIEEMKNVYFSFPGYKEKIKQFGLVAFVLE